MDQASSVVDQQKWFEQNVLKMNFKSFTQIVVLGSSTFVPFMQLTAPNRREVIEDLLDIKILFLDAAATSLHWRPFFGSSKMHCP